MPMFASSIAIRIPWMKLYRGVSVLDAPTKDGSFTAKPDSFGGYVFNFMPYQGVLLGSTGLDSEIDVERLGAPKGADQCYGVRVFWVAYSAQLDDWSIIGWYLDARVYKYPQTADANSGRKLPDGSIAKFQIKAEMSVCDLFKESMRFPYLNNERLAWEGNFLYPSSKSGPDNWEYNVLKLVQDRRLGRSSQYYETIR